VVPLLRSIDFFQKRICFWLSEEWKEVCRRKENSKTEVGFFSPEKKAYISINVSWVSPLNFEEHVEKLLFKLSNLLPNFRLKSKRIIKVKGKRGYMYDLVFGDKSDKMNKCTILQVLSGNKIFSLYFYFMDGLKESDFSIFSFIKDFNFA
jgi:hypothetical protein